MQPQNIDMGVIREAMARRRMGGAMPAGQQMTQPTAPNPVTGGFPTPTAEQPVRQPDISPQQMAGRQQKPGAASMNPLDGESRQVALQLAQRILVSDPTNNKQLLQKLVQAL